MADGRGDEGRRDRRAGLREMRERGSKDPRTRFNLRFWLLALLALLAFQVFVAWRTTAQLSYMDFLALAGEGAIERVVVTDRFLEGELATPDEEGRTQFVTTRVDPDLAEELAGLGLKVEGRVESNILSTLLSWIVPAALFVGL